MKENQGESMGQEDLEVKDKEIGNEEIPKSWQERKREGDLKQTKQLIASLDSGCEMSAQTKRNGGRGMSWCERETLDLLSFWGEEKVQESLYISHRNIDIFEKIAEQMASHGHKRSATECRTKTKTLRQEYKRVATHNHRSGGSSPVTCPFYEELHSILHWAGHARPKRVARKLNFQAVDKVQQPCLEERGGSEEPLSNDDLLTIDPEHFHCSSPADISSCENLPSTVESVPVDGEQAEIRITDCIEPGRCENLPSTVESVPVDRELAETRIPDCIEPAVSGTDEGKVVADLSPATRLATVRKRKRRGAVLHDVAEQILKRCATEQELSKRRHREMMEEEKRRHNELLEEGRKDRQVFEFAMQQNMNIMLAALNALKTLGELFAGKQQPVNVQGTPQRAKVPHQEE